MKRSRQVLRSHWTTVDGLRMHARVSAVPLHSEKPPILLVHGLGVSSLYMVPLAQHLAPHFQVLAPDLPGYGRSEKPDRPLDIAGLAGVLRTWMDAHGIAKAPMLGNSLGCQIVIEFARRYPDRITHVILSGPTVDPEARTMLRQIGRGILDIPRERFSLLLICVFDYLRMGVYRFLKTLQFLVEDSVEEKLSKVNVPTLVLRGEADPIVPERWTKEATKRLRYGSCLTIPNAAHAAHYTAPAYVAKTTRAFIQHAETHRSTGDMVSQGNTTDQAATYRIG